MGELLPVSVAFKTKHTALEADCQGNSGTKQEVPFTKPKLESHSLQVSQCSLNRAVVTKLSKNLFAHHCVPYLSVADIHARVGDAEEDVLRRGPHERDVAVAKGVPSGQPLENTFCTLRL